MGWSFDRLWVLDCWGWATRELGEAAGAQAFLENALLQGFVRTAWASLLLEVWVGRSLEFTGLMLLVVSFFAFRLIRGCHPINIWLKVLRIQSLWCFIIFIRTITSNHGLHRTILSKGISTGNGVWHNQRFYLAWVLFHRGVSKRCFLYLFVSLFDDIYVNTGEPCHTDLFRAQALISVHSSGGADCARSTGSSWGMFYLFILLTYSSMETCFLPWAFFHEVVSLVQLIYRLLMEFVFLALAFVIITNGFLLQIRLEARREDGAWSFFGSVLLFLWCFMYDFNFLCARSGNVVSILSDLKLLGLVIRFAILRISQRFKIRWDNYIMLQSILSLWLCWSYTVVLVFAEGTSTELRIIAIWFHHIDVLLERAALRVLWLWMIIQHAIRMKSIYLLHLSQICCQKRWFTFYPEVNFVNLCRISSSRSES